MASDPQTVTLKTIADELGVSISTVARSLKDGHKISPSMIEKVRETADRLGYVRNMDGVKLRTGQSFVIMALLGVTDEEEIGDSGSVGLLNGLHARFSETEYSIRTIPVTIGDTGLDAVMDVVRSRNSDGLVLDHTEPDDPRVAFLLERDIPFVTFGRTDRADAHAYFDIDNEYAAWQGTKALIEAGYRKIACLDADPKFAFVQQRMQGYARALAEQGLPLDRALIKHTPLDAGRVRDMAEHLSRQGVDAFLCVNELVFLGARAGARRAAGDAADQMGFSVRTGTNFAEYLGTPVYASHLSRVEAGRTLADLLLRRLEGAPIAQCQTVVKTELRIHQF